jgi:hypothetical protein
MAYSGGTGRRLDARAEAGCFLALLGATGLAIAHPVLDAFGKSPEAFVFRHADSSDLVLFAVAIALVPPTVLWMVGLLIGIVLPNARRAVHGGSGSHASITPTCRTSMCFPQSRHSRR